MLFINYVFIISLFVIEILDRNGDRNLFRGSNEDMRGFARDRPIQARERNFQRFQGRFFNYCIIYISKEYLGFYKVTQ